MVDRLHGGVVKAMTSPRIRDCYLNGGADVTVRGPEAFGAPLGVEFDKWAKIVTDPDVRID